MHRLKIEITKFTLVGAANFMLTFIVFAVLLKVMSVGYLISLFSAWLIGLLFSYALNFMWVFKPAENIQFNGRFLKYLSTSSISVVGNMLILKMLVESTNLDPFYVQLALIPLVVLFNYFAAKYWSLGPRGTVVTGKTGSGFRKCQGR